MKNLFIAILLFGIFSCATAQNFYGGINVGVSGSQVDGDQQSGYSKPGLIAGVFVGHPFGDKFSGDIELYYIGKGAVKQQKYADGTVWEEFKSHFNYVEMSIMPRWRAHEKFSVSAGLATAYLISEKLYNLGSLIDKDQYSMRNFDISPMAKVDFHFTKKLSINVRFSYSVISIRKDFGWFNNNMCLALRYRLGK